MSKRLERTFDAPFADPILRAWANAAAKRHMGVDGPTVFGKLLPRIMSHVMSDTADIDLVARQIMGVASRGDDDGK